MPSEKKGITVKIDADLHAEVKAFIEQNGLTMADFVFAALDHELHPQVQEREEHNMEKMRTMAFQIPESMFQRIKDYLARHGISQKQFVLGLIERELDSEQGERQAETPRSEMDEDEDEEQDETPVETICEDEDEDADEDEAEDEDEDLDEGESQVFGGIGM